MAIPTTYNRINMGLASEKFLGFAQHKDFLKKVYGVGSNIFTNENGWKLHVTVFRNPNCDYKLLEVVIPEGYNMLYREFVRADKSSAVLQNLQENCLFHDSNLPEMFSP